MDNGCTAWSSALFYGNFHETPDKLLDNIRLIGAFFDKVGPNLPLSYVMADEQYPEYKDKVTLVVKGGLQANFQPTLEFVNLTSPSP